MLRETELADSIEAVGSALNELTGSPAARRRGVVGAGGAP
jgi:hypothetical protein